MIVMDQIIFVCRVRCKRDVVQAGQRARQIAGLLGFAGTEQAALAAAAFLLADRTCVRKKSRLVFRVVDRAFRMSVEPGAGDCIEKALSENTPVAAEDLTWLAGELQRRTPLDVYEEIRRL